jgi:hypothetical protein
MVDWEAAGVRMAPSPDGDGDSFSIPPGELPLVLYTPEDWVSAILYRDDLNSDLLIAFICELAYIGSTIGQPRLKQTLAHIADTESIQRSSADA